MPSTSVPRTANPSGSRVRRRRALLVSLLAAAAFAVATPPVAAQEAPAGAVPTTVAPPPAGAADTTTAAPPPTTAAPGAATPTGGAAATAALEALLPALTPITDAATMEELRARYGSLSVSLIALYADQTGAPLDEFVAGNADQLAAALGATDRAVLQSAASLSGGSVEGLTAALASRGLVSDWRAGSLEGFASNLSANAQSIEARVVAAGADWAARLAALRSPDVQAPQMPALQGSAEALAVGLFTQSATTAMVTDFPDLFAQVRSSGVGTPEAGAAWRASMVNALAATQADLSAALPNRCYGALMTAMASGDAAAARAVGDGCGTCVATGLYLNGQMSRLFDPQVGTTQPNVRDSLLPPAEFNQLQPWQRAALGAQNPQLSATLSATLTGTAPLGGCGGSAGAGAAAQTILPGVFANLTGGG